MRISRTAVVGAALVALIVSACGPGADSPTPAASPAGSPVASPAASPADSPATSPVASPAVSPGGGQAGTTLASTLTFGGPPECPQRPFCLIGLQETYGLQFAEFRPLDSGGPITVEALDSGEVDVALLFSSDPTIQARGFVLLEDDQRLQRADNLIPIVSASFIDEQPAAADLLNSVSAQLTQDELITLNRQATEDRDDPRDIAGAWLQEQGLLDAADSSAGSGASQITVGKSNFYEQDILAELYAQILEANGFTVARQEASGTREVVFPALESGEIDILPEYAATALEYVNEGADEATGDAEETAERLRERLEPMGLTALDPAPATNQNAIAVTSELADQYGLERISDLGQPAP
jgi:glycine betaine/choline ABC-type transport system substrate-binding protein